MAKFKMFVLTNAVPGQEAEFEDWYDKIHLQQVADIPGFVSAQRFRLRRMVDEEAKSFSSLAVYEMDTDDVDTAIAELQARSGTDALIVSDSLSQVRLYAGVYEEAGPLVEAS